jgi:hypothetical protein
VEHFHLVDEVELVTEFLVDRPVRLVAAGGYVEIVQADLLGRFFKDDREMAGIADAAIVAPVCQLMQRQAGDGGDAVIALLAMDGDVFVTQRLQRRKREEIVGNLGFLQADDIRRPGFNSCSTIGMRSRTELMFQVAIDNAMQWVLS